LTDYTPSNLLAKIAQKTVDWHEDEHANLEKIDLGISGAVVRNLELGEAVAAYDAVGFDSVATLEHIILATVADPVECCGVALAAGVQGDVVPVLMRGVLELGTSVNPAGPLTLGKSVFLGVDGALVYETDASRYGDVSSNRELFQQRVGYVLRSSSGAENDALLIAPQRGHRAVGCIVPSRPSIMLTGSAAESFLDTGSSVFARARSYAAGATYATIFDFTLPNNFREFPDADVWAFEVWYKAASAVTVKVDGYYDTGGTFVALSPSDTGSSTSWARHFVTGAELVAAGGTLTKGKNIAFSLSVSGGAAGTSYVEAVARLRYGPEWGTFGAVI